MKDDFFKLKGETTKIESFEEFDKLLKQTNHVKDSLYWPDKLNPNKDIEYKIHNKTFDNFSFSKTDLENIYFYNCKFKNCLFIGTEFKNCRIQQSEFSNCNTWRCQIENTYINPRNFKNSIKNYSHSNIGAELFHQLLENSKNEQQPKFILEAEFYLMSWERKLLFYNIIKCKQKWWHIATLWLPNYLYFLIGGYGIRIVNFMVSFALFLVGALVYNNYNWKSYNLKSTIYKEPTFVSDSTDVLTNVYYTVGSVTQIMDPQIYPQSKLGLQTLMFQSILGFIFISLLITLILKRLLK